MKTLECDNPNNNSFYLIKLINNLTELTENYYWIIADLDLIPIFKGDYSGIGNERDDGVAYTLLKTIEKSKVVSLDYDQLMQILYDTLTVRNVVLTCFEKSCNIDLNTFRPRVESASKKMYDSRAKYEIRILDGELFFVLTE